MNTIKFSRQDYLNNKCSHREYYAQFVTAHTIAVVKGRFGLEVIKQAIEQDEHINSIPLSKWDALAGSVRTDGKMKEAGDFLTLAGSVCILKEAAKQLVENEQQAVS